MCGISLVIRFKRRFSSANVVDAPHPTLTPSVVPTPTFACCSSSSTSSPVDLETMDRYNARRGPDVTSSFAFNLEKGDGSSFVSMVATGSVLHLRGSHVLSPQPRVSTTSSLESLSCPAVVRSSDASWLLWNGEVFGGATVVVPADACDTDLVLCALVKCESQASSLGAMEEAVRDVLEGIHGPFAVIFYSARFRVVFFARDPIGRRSLLVHRSRERISDVGAVDRAEVHDEVWIISSVAAPHEGELSLHNALRQPSQTRFCQAAADAPFSSAGDGGDNGEEEIEDNASAVECGCWCEVPTGGIFVLPTSLGNHVADSVNLNPRDEKPQSAFSSSSISENDDGPPLRFVPWCGGQHAVHPVLRGRGPGSSAAAVPTHSDMSSFLIQSVLTSVNYQYQPSIDADLACATAFLHALAAAVAVRTSSSTTRSVAPSDTATNKTPIALLFSGGIDCTVLAALCHYLLPPDQPIELINVSFADPPECSPDRISCISSIPELLHLPTPSHGGQLASGSMRREWRLILVDASPKEVAPTNRAHILNLIYPRNSVMDDNIGTAVWYGARGVGRCFRLAHAGRDCAQRADPLCESSSLRTNDSSAGVASHSSSLRIGDPAAVAVAPPAVIACAAVEEDNRVFDALVEVLIEDAANTRSFRERNDSCEGDVVAAAVATPLTGTVARMNATGVLLSTLGKEYGARLTPVWKRAGFRKLGAYLSAAEAAGYVAFGGGSTSKFVALCRPQDIEAAKRRSSAGSPENLRSYFVPASFEHDGNVVVDDDRCYRCESRVLLLGMGADETLGGYARYRRVFRQHEQAARRHGNNNNDDCGGGNRNHMNDGGGLDAVVAEIQRDFARLWTRNLGRDDRVVSDHGREGRFPYLDEDVLAVVRQVAYHRPCVMPADEATGSDNNHQETVRCDDYEGALPRKAASTPPPFLHEVVDVSLPEGIGDKKLLRTAARLLGLGPCVSQLHKRAIQFGSRIATRIQRGSAPLSATIGSLAHSNGAEASPCVDSEKRTPSRKLAPLQDVAGEAAKRRRVE